MKLKEIDRNGNTAWSPKSINESYLVVGTASQQLDTSFSTKSQLEIFEYIPSEKGCEMPVVSSIISDTKFSKLLWGNFSNNKGVIVGGSDSGAISIYDCTELLSNKSSEELSRISVKRDHKGPVNAMDFNKFKPNLLATGGAESDIFIWDLEKFDEPMTPGNKSQPFEEIRCLSWNHKVQHILGSTSTHRCQIWDLRKSDPVIKLSDSQMKIKSHKLVWHPDISTRLCISSEDDHTPIIQLWDLRYIQCPFHTLQRHTKGIVDLDWCIDDSDILMSIGRDRQMICWNMSPHNNTSTNVNVSSEVIYEWQLDQEMINEANFCPKHPGLISVSSFDCHISLYSLMGGRGHVSRELSDTVIDSFPMELNEENNDEIERIKKEAEKAAELQLAPTPCLSKAPKWLKRSCGANFSFGGRLIQFCKTESSRSRNNSLSQTGSLANSDSPYRIIISRVHTNKDLVKSSNALENAIQSSDSMQNYCRDKIQAITTQIRETDNQKYKSDCMFDLNVWKFIECHFDEDSRSAFMQSLGYNDANKKDEEINLSEHNEDFSPKHTISSVNAFENDQNEKSSLSLENIQLIPNNNQLEKSLSIALMTGDIESAVNICLKENRYGEAAILAVSSGRQDLFEKVQWNVFHKPTNQSFTTNLIYIAVKRNWHELVRNCDLNYWKEALTWLLTYAGTEELSDLCETLGRRLEEQVVEQNDSIYSLSACICYICSGSINEFVRCWMNFNSLKSIKDLQRLIEIIILLCKSIGDDDFSLIKGNSAEIFKNYASLLVSQGSLATALKYLGNNDENKILMLRHRICESLRNNLPVGITAPQSPFKITPILSSVSQQRLKQMNSSLSSYSELPKQTNQMPNMFPPSPVYQMKNSNFPNTMQPSIQKISNNYSSMNFVPNQYNRNSYPTQSQMSGNKPPTHFTQYPTQSSGMPLSQLPFIPNNPSNLMNIAAPSVPLPQPTNNSIIRKPNNQINKSGWNDPPLLSENYRKIYLQNKIAMDKYEHVKSSKQDENTESNKEEIKTPQTFFSPTAPITDISELNNLGNKFSANINNYGNVESSNNFSVINDENISKKIGSSNNESNLCQILSPESKHIQNVLLNLIEKCKQKDQSRQMKVKMDEIQRKFSNLFEVLQSQSLSPELTSGLMNLITTLESNNYRKSFDEVNNIIQTVNFSEAGLFLPSVKMLIQCAVKIFE